MDNEEELSRPKRADDSGTTSSGASAPRRASAPADGTGAHATGERRKRGVLPLLAGLLALVLALVGGWMVYTKVMRPDVTKGGPAIPEYSPSATSKAPTKPAATTPRGSAIRSTTKATPAPAGCSSPTVGMENPKTLSIPSMKVESPMLSLGLDDSGAAAAPPKSASHTTGWYNKGPKIGANKGNAILTIHTYRNGGALGNELNSDKGLKPGAEVKVTDDKGTVVCYTVDRALKIWVKDYDPNSNVLYDNNGKPQAVIVICWDFNWDTKDWDSRILYYLKPVAPAA